MSASVVTKVVLLWSSFYRYRLLRLKLDVTGLAWGLGMSDVGKAPRGYNLYLARLRIGPFAIGDDGEANAIRGIALGCAVSTVFWVGLGAIVRAALG
jgi:hypothetical protein